jgi:hypothetical protein
MSDKLDSRNPAPSGRALVLGGGGSAGNAWGRSEAERGIRWSGACNSRPRSKNCVQAVAGSKPSSLIKRPLTLSASM